MEWRIFFIGPIGNKKSGKGSAKTVGHSPHLSKLHKYVVSHLETSGYTQTNLAGHIPTQDSHTNGVSLERGGDKITVLIPSDLHDSGNIPEEIFDAIDHSDLIIADLSGNRPEVIYELAFAHALGIETILVGGPNTRSFYLLPNRIINIDFRAKTISSPDLDAVFDWWLNRKNKLFNSTNPMQQFYGVPLPDISAPSGLAAGFYDNFARPILTGGEIVHRELNSEGTVSEHRSAIKGLIVLRPENLASSIMEMEDALEELLNSRFPGEVKRGAPEKTFILTNEGARTAFFLVRDYLIDIPRTMFSLALSPRLRRYTDKSLKSDMEGVLINRFFASVKNYLAHDQVIREEKKKFHFGSIEEIPSIIETGQSKTWTQY
jgi:hypothetical protein